MPEVLITIALLGILLAIAIPSWNSVVKGRAADSAANQFASDLRLAHTRATNQLSEWHVIYSHDSGEYTLVRQSDDYMIDRSLEDAIVLTSEVSGTGGTIEFKPSGSVEVAGFTDADADGEFDITVSATDGSQPRSIAVNMTTSRVELI